MHLHSLGDVGQAIRAARRDAGLTQEAAAALCGVSMPFLNQLEGAKRLHLSISKVLGVMDALGIRLEATGPGVPRDSSATADIDTDGDCAPTPSPPSGTGPSR